MSLTGHRTYDIWRNNNPNKRLNLNASKLANVRRDILNHQVWSERDGITTPYERDANAVPGEQIANKKQQNDKNRKCDVQEPLNIYRFTQERMISFSLDLQDEIVSVMWWKKVSSKDMK